MLDHAAPPEAVLTPEELRRRHIRRSDYVSCSLAFIDCRKPGSHLKQNYSIIGPGVTTSADQVVNLREPHGFNIGAAAMPHGIVNNLHIHYTAEVFLVFGGEWTFRWGPQGGDGEFVAHEGDVVSVPTWILRGFTNTGPDDGWIFTALGGDDTGGVIWDPEILREAAGYGLYLGRDGTLIDTAAGAPKPAAKDLVTPLKPEDLAALERWTPERMRVERVVTAADRRWSAAALLDAALPGHGAEVAPVIGHGLSEDRRQQAPLLDPHGFTLDWLRLPPGGHMGPFRLDRKLVLIARQAGVTARFNRGAPAAACTFGALDTLAVPAGVWCELSNPGDTPVELAAVVAGDGRHRLHWDDALVAAAEAAGIGLDPAGYLASSRMLPPPSRLLRER